MANATYRITTAAENPLCGRLKSKYSARMNAACDPNRRAQAVSRPVSKAEKTVRNIATPFESTMEFVPAKAAVKKTAASAENVRRANGVRTSDAAARRVKAFEKTTPFRTGTFSAAYSRAAQIRARAYDGTEAKESIRREKERREAMREPAPLTKRWLENILSGRSDEVRVKSTPISKSAIITIILVAAVVLMIIFSLSEINSFKNDISALEKQKLELNTEITQLSLDIDRKNDVKKIEQIATEEIGMVKSNQVQSRYISLNGGDRVEVIGDENGESEDYGVFSTLLSTFGNNWDTLRDYID